MKLGEKIGNLRRLQGFSQEQLAERLHISRQAVSKWEVGDALPDASNPVSYTHLDVYKRQALPPWMKPETAV